MPWSGRQRKMLTVLVLYYLLRRRRRERNRRAERLRRERRQRMRLQQSYSSDETEETNNTHFEEESGDVTDTNDFQIKEEELDIKEEMDSFDEDSNQYFNEELDEQTNENTDIKVDIDEVMVGEEGFLNSEDSNEIAIKEETLEEMLPEDSRDSELVICGVKHDVDDSSSSMNVDPLTHCLDMTVDDFQALVEMIGPLVKKQDTKLRLAIPVEDRVGAALRYLETGGPFRNISQGFNISKQAICKTLPEVCNALIECLENKPKMPNCSEDWLSIANKFETLHKIPNCVGILVGRRIDLQKRADQVCDKTCIGLFVLIDAEYNVLFSEVVDMGSTSEDFNFDTSELYKKIISNEINLPPEKALPGRNKPMPYVFLANRGFPLTPNIIKGYTEPEDVNQRKFNDRLGVVDGIFENILGFLSTRFHVWRKQLALKAETTQVVLKSTICLYNFLRRNELSKLINCPEGTFDAEIGGKIVEGAWRAQKLNVAFLNTAYLPFSDCCVSLENGAEVRDEFASYFSY